MPKVSPAEGQAKVSLPLAISAPGWTAIGAVAGAFVGATAGSLIDYVFQRRRERAEAKAGARLVAADIAMADGRLKGAQEDAKWWRFVELPMTAWPEYRAVLAKELTNAEFEAVSQAVEGLRILGEKMPLSPAFPIEASFMELSEANVRTLDGPRTNTARAYNALSKLAGHDRVTGERIHPASPPAPPQSPSKRLPAVCRGKIAGFNVRK